MAETTYVDADVDRIRRFEGQPRKRFSKAGLQELADSISEVGQIVPAVVRRVTGDKDIDFELVDGERRWRACQLAGKRKLRAIIEETPDDERFARSVAANFGRQEHTPMEIAAAIRTLHLGGKTQSQVAKVFGKSQVWVSRFETLNNLCPEVVAMVEGDDEQPPALNVSQAMAVALLPKDQQLAVAQRAVQQELKAFDLHRVVRKVAADSGTPLRGRPIKPSDDLSALVSFLNRTAEAAERFMTMPEDRVKDMLAGRTRNDRQNIAEKVEGVSGDLAMFAEMVGTLVRRLNVAGMAG